MMKLAAIESFKDFFFQMLGAQVSSKKLQRRGSRSRAVWLIQKDLFIPEESENNHTNNSTTMYGYG
jgi:hypothetical protein